MPDIADDEEKPTMDDRKDNEPTPNLEGDDKKEEGAEEENQIDSKAIVVENADEGEN